MWAGFAGGLVLMAFGIGSFFKKRISEEHFFAPTSTPHNLASYWLRGFLLNTINPFTVFFWIGIASGMVVPGNWSSAEIFLFFGAMLGTLVVTDTLKAYAAKRLRQWLTPQHIRHAQRIIGVLLVIFGIVMISRVM
jgi:threonine/homoserine/homoserine lactone efflux protein